MARKLRHVLSWSAAPAGSRRSESRLPASNTRTSILPPAASRTFRRTSAIARIGRAASANQDGDPRKRGSFTGNPLERGAVAPWIVDTHWEYRPRELPAESRNQPVFDFALREFKLVCDQSETRTARGVIEGWKGRWKL